jgi:hypothetical protein
VWRADGQVELKWPAPYRSKAAAKAVVHPGRVLHLLQQQQLCVVVTPCCVVSCCAAASSPQVPSARLVLRKAVLDAGAKQLDPFTVDVRGSLEQYQQTAVVNRESMLEAEVQWLQSNHVDLVVSDVVPIVCAAAAAAGIPAVCVSNFSWGEWRGPLSSWCCISGAVREASGPVGWQEAHCHLHQMGL